jgi:hypothetical protein
MLLNGNEKKSGSRGPWETWGEGATDEDDPGRAYPGCQESRGRSVEGQGQMMDDEKDSAASIGGNFLYLQGDDKTISLLNLDQIRMVDEIREGHLRIWFSETHKVEMHGTGATQVAGLLLGRKTITPEGESFGKVFLRERERNQTKEGDKPAVPKAE